MASEIWVRKPEAKHLKMHQERWSRNLLLEVRKQVQHQLAVRPHLRGRVRRAAEV
jgi:hypothetical protein